MLHTHIGSHFIQHQKHNKSQRKDVEKIEFYLSALLFFNQSSKCDQRGEKALLGPE
jgi:hypothetical protein